MKFEYPQPQQHQPPTVDNKQTIPYFPALNSKTDYLGLVNKLELPTLTSPCFNKLYALICCVSICEKFLDMAESLLEYKDLMDAFGMVSGSGEGLSSRSRSALIFSNDLSSLEDS